MAPAHERARFTQQHAARGLLAVAVLGSAMALGALHVGVLMGVAGVLALAAAAAWWGAGAMRARPAATLLLWAGVGLTLFTALQAVPLPAAWLGAIAPANADVWSRCLLPLHEPGPRFASISLDPIATRIQVLRGVAYLLAFVAALRIANRREGVVFLEGVIIVTGVALAVAAWVHPAVGAERVFGLFRPMEPVSPRHLAPILNANFLAGYLNIAFCLALSQAIALRPTVPRAIAIATVIVLLATQIWVASRGGVIAMVFGAAVVVWMTRIAVRGPRVARIGLALPVGLVIAGVGMGVLSSSEEAWQELADADMTKLELTRRALGLVPHFPFLGLGRGAFASVFPAFRAGTGHIVYTHPENVVAQWLTEWGVPVALLGFLALGLALRPRSALVRSAPASGAWAALACLGVHNLVDFSSELPAAVLALAVCAAIVVGGTAGTTPRLWAENWSQRPRLLTLLGLCAAAGGILWVLPGMGMSLVDDRESMRGKALDPSVKTGEFHAAIRAAMLRHPAEPYLPFTGGLWAALGKDESVIAWVERTLERAPIYGRAHLLLARELAKDPRRRSLAQARLEYRVAMTQDESLVGYAVTEGMRLVGGYYDAMELVPEPEGPTAVAVLNQLARAIGARLPASRARLDAQIRTRSPNDIELATRALVDAKDDLAQGEAAPWCESDRQACVSHGLSLADRLEQLEPNQCAPHDLRASILAEGGQSAHALDSFEAAAEKVTDRTACLRQFVLFAVRQNDRERANNALDKLGRMGCSTDAECVENLLFVANVEAGRGNVRRALAFYKKASERAPQNTGLLANVGGLASQLGMHAEALEAYRALGRIEPSDSAWKAATAREERALMVETLPGAH